MLDRYKSFPTISLKIVRLFSFSSFFFILNFSSNGEIVALWLVMQNLIKISCPCYCCVMKTPLSTWKIYIIKKYPMYLGQS